MICTSFRIQTKFRLEYQWMLVMDRDGHKTHKSLWHVIFASTRMRRAVAGQPVHSRSRFSSLWKKNCRPDYKSRIAKFMRCNKEILWCQWYSQPDDSPWLTHQADNKLGLCIPFLCSPVSIQLTAILGGHFEISDIELPLQIDAWGNFNIFYCNPMVLKHISSHKKYQLVRF